MKLLFKIEFLSVKLYPSYSHNLILFSQNPKLSHPFPFPEKKKKPSQLSSQSGPLPISPNKPKPQNYQLLLFTSLILSLTQADSFLRKSTFEKKFTNQSQPHPTSTTSHSPLLSMRHHQQRSTDFHQWLNKPLLWLRWILFNLGLLVLRRVEALPLLLLRLWILATPFLAGIAYHQARCAIFYIQL